MGFFSKAFKKGDSSTSSRAQSRAAKEVPQPIQTSQSTYGDAWTRKEVAADEVQELLHVCTQEMKSRALDMPFLLLPYRPDSDANAVKTFIRIFFRNASDPHNNLSTGSALVQELRITEPTVICSVMKWCWGRLNGGVVGWDAYELFKQGERESRMAKHAFDTFIPLSVESEARKKIIFDFFELLAAIAANGKTNGLGGRKLSRLAGWWAFELSDDNNGFDGGYASWAKAANATSHLFFAYLRSLSPNTAVESTVSKLPRSLQALLGQTEYPPQTPTGLMIPTSKVVMVVGSVSPTPFTLLRRAKNFDYLDDDRALQTFSDYDDPVKALTPECRRVLEAISTTSSTSQPLPELNLASPTSPTDGSWSRFEDMGFSSLLDGSNTNADATADSRKTSNSKPRRSEAGRKSGVNDLGRPATPSWADFMSSGFSDDDSTRAPTSLLLPPDQILPPLSQGRAESSQSHAQGLKEDSNEPGELAGVTRVHLDETFWWVWITSLAQEELPSRKGVFGRCAFVETEISGGRWLVVEEQVKGAAPVPSQTVMVPEKKHRFATLTKRGRDRRTSMGKTPPVPKSTYEAGPQHSKTTIGPDQQAKVQAAAAALVQQKIEEENEGLPGRRRGRTNEHDDTKTNSVMTLGMQPVLAKEAGPAMQWARKFDKETVRQQYLGDNSAGRDLVDGPSPNASTINLETAMSAGEATSRAQRHESLDRELPPPPPAQGTFSQEVPYTASAPPEVPAKDVPLMEPQAQAGSSIGAFTALPSTIPGAIESEKTMVVPAPLPASPDATTQGEVVLANSTPSPRVQRKPVGSVDSIQNDGAFSQGNGAVRSSPQSKPSTPSKTPAAAAAAAAAARSADRNNAEAQTSPPQAGRKASTRGFRGMFNNKKTPTPEVPTYQPATNGSNLNVEKPAVGRTSSFLRRKQMFQKLEAQPQTQTPPKATTSPKALVPVPASEPEGAADDAVKARDKYYSSFEGGEPGPEYNQSESTDFGQGPDEATEATQSQITSNPNESSAQFSNFSQGPLEDVPAFVPDDDPVAPDERAPSPSQPVPGSFTTRAANLLAPNRPAPVPPQSEPNTAQSSEFQTPMAMRESDPMDEQRTPIARTIVPDASPSTEEITALPSSRPVDATAKQQPFGEERDRETTDTAADRWAQIRKNAVERRTSGDQVRDRSHSSAQGSQAQSVGTEKTDDGETSGEETIESRVARIKARVAELTGGQNGGGQNPGSQGVATR